MKEITKRYPKEEIDIIWQPHKCIHSAVCIRGLPTVFNNQERPWIKPEGAEKQRIVDQVNKCPSGALSIKNKNQQTQMENNSPVKVEVMNAGPLIIKSGCIIVNKDGTETVKEGSVALCRCGQSKNKPYCDGAHRSTQFDV